VVVLKSSAQSPAANPPTLESKSELPRLADFIRDNIEQILNEWEAFARALPIAAAMDIETLRDHARGMLSVIATDLETPQSPGEESAKAKGQADAGSTGSNTAAQEHGAGRAGGGFTVEQMVAEFRALRASVIRLWVEKAERICATDLDDMTRFNEAVDQAIAESIERYTSSVTESKERFLAILGHDLKNPIGSIMGATQFMVENAGEKGDLPEPYLGLTTRAEITARRMNRLVDDLLDFARTSFGDAIPIERSPADAGAILREVEAEVKAAHPASRIEIHTDGDLRGNWDGARLAQALTNLVGNAVQHGAADGTVRVHAHGLPTEVAISVANRGPTIPRERIGQLFQPMKMSGKARRVDDQHLGLGLYIVDKIIEAHGGSISVESSASMGTVFTVHLSRAVGN
jgi:signal transduction histidine kinase